MDDSYEIQATTRRNFKGDKILLIDDNADQCELIRAVLHGCMPVVELLIASTQEEAFSQLSLCLIASKGLPRLILLDLYLPHADDGLRVVEQVKKMDSPFRLIPLTLLTHSASEQDIRRGCELGVNSYIVKPTNYAQWLRYVESLRDYWWHTVTLPPG